MSSVRSFHSGDQRHQSGLTSQPPSRHPSGLVRVVEATGRTRGSSATPQPAPVISPTPNRGFQTRSQLNNINNSINHTPPGMSNSNGPDLVSPMSPSRSSMNRVGAVYNRNQNSVNNQLSPAMNREFNNYNGNTARSQPAENYNSGSMKMSGSRVSDSLKCDMPTEMDIGSLTAQFQATFIDIQQRLARGPNLPQSTHDILNQQILKMCQESSESQRRLQRELDNVRADRDNIQEKLNEAQRQLDSVIQDRARISSERDSLQLRISELDLKTKKSTDRIEDVEKDWKKINEGLLERIRIQEEQLKGKRALWMDVNPNSTSRRSAMSAIQDPFTSPTPNHSSGFRSGPMADINSPSASSPLPGKPSPVGQHTPFRSQIEACNSQNVYAPASLVRVPSAPCGPSGTPSQPDLLNRMDTRRRSNLPMPSPLQANESADSFDRANSLRRYNTEPSESMAMVPFNKEEDLSLEFKSAIGKVYRLVQNWVKAHTDQPDRENDQAIARSNHFVWNYMLNCIYPGRQQDSHPHVIALLENPKTRFWFVMRMAVEYCIKHIISVDAFKAFSQPVAEAIDDAKKNLQERGLANDARQILIDRQSEAVQSIMDSPRFNGFRNEQLNLHTKHLRDLLGPLLNNGCNRAQAGKELGTIAVTAWDLSVKMYTSHLSFQVYFPETTAKFNAATMVATDSDAPPLRLQIQQSRLKLIITPVITMRDDRGTTIKAKNLHMSNVLLIT